MAREKYLVYARKWRPQAFEDVVGQEHITRTLQNSIAAQRIPHAFLFIGSRGIGKTTTARILAKALNCLSSEQPTAHPCGTCDNCQSIAEGNNIDVIEIDGASNNTVDDVREIREHVRLVPSRSRYKVYIIDEVHQLSISAFNALLKTLEEPPAHAVFILATTETQKVPATIISRCQRFDFRRVAVDKICALLRAILEKEQVTCSEEALYAIARAAEGGIRDAESILDQLVSYCEKEITFQDVFDVLGLVDWRVLHELCDAIGAQDINRQLRIVADVVDCGKDLSQFVQEILRYYRNLLVCKTADAKALLALPDDELALMQARAAKFTLTQLIRLVEQFAELTKGFDSQFAQRIALESLLIQISKRSVEVSADVVIEKIMQLAERLSGAGPVTLDTPPVNDPPAEREPEPAAVDVVPITVTQGTLAEIWPRIVEDAARNNVGFRLALDQARPLDIHDDAVILHFELRTSQALGVLEKPENRKSLEQSIAKLTRNLATFRTEIAEEKPLREEPPKAKGRATKAAGPRVKPEEAQAALDDPHVAKVTDIFKGQIVDIKHH